MNKEFLKKVSILLVSFMVASGASINATIPAMAEGFQDIPLSLVEMLATIPSMFLIISVLISNFIAKKIGYKRTILIGVGIVAICGMVPTVTNNFYLIFASRALFGFGIGLFNSLLVALISYFYDGEERITLFGFQSAFEGIGGMSVTFISGQLLKISWQTAFYAYSIAIPILIVFALFVPNVPTHKILEKTKRSVGNGIHANNDSSGVFKVVGYVGLIFFTAILFMTMGIKVTSLMIDAQYGTATDGSTVFMLLGFGSMTSGFLFGKVVKITKKFTLPIAYALLSTAMFLIGVSNSVFLTAFGGFLVGYSFRMIMPYLINRMNSGIAKNSAIATSLLLVGYNLGAALAPYGSMILEKFAWEKSLRGIFLIDGTILAAFAIIGAIFTLINFKKNIDD